MRKAISLVLAACFGANAALADAPETHFWAERRRQARHAATAPPWQVAALPAAAAPPLLDAPLRALTPAAAERFAWAAGAPSDEISSLLQTIPAEHARIRRFADAPAARKTVIHIQDVHQNEEAQRHIGAAARALADAGRAGLIALEGAFDSIDVDAPRAFPDAEVRSAVADDMLSKGEISGPVHAALAGGAAWPPFAGVDDAALHRRNVDAYRRAAPRAPLVKARLAALRRELAARKAAAFSPALAALDARIEDHRAGRLPLGGYLRALADANPAGEPENARLFLKAVAAESSIDFARAEAERADLVRALAARAAPGDLRALAADGAAHRLGRIGTGDFYRRLRAACERAGVPLSRFPAMDAYVGYVLLADRVDAVALFGESAAMERAALARLARTPEEKALSAEGRRLHFADKLSDFSLTPEEWGEYALDPFRAEGLDLSAAEDFYRAAEARNRSLADNLLAAMDRAGTRTALLVAGGFHSLGVEAALKARGAACLTITPTLTKLEDAPGGAYLAAFTREKTPLERIVAGEKLFVAKDPCPPSVPFTLALRGLALLAALGRGVADATDFLRRFSGRMGGRVRSARVSAAAGAARVHVALENGAVEAACRRAGDRPVFEERAADRPLLDRLAALRPGFLWGKVVLIPAFAAGSFEWPGFALPIPIPVVFMAKAGGKRRGAGSGKKSGGPARGRAATPPPGPPAGPPVPEKRLSRRKLLWWAGGAVAAAAAGIAGLRFFGAPPRSTAPSVYRPHRLRHDSIGDFKAHRKEMEAEVERAIREGREVVFVMEYGGPEVNGRAAANRELAQMSTPARREAWARGKNKEMAGIMDEALRRAYETGRFESTVVNKNAFLLELEDFLSWAVGKGARLSIALERVSADAWVDSIRGLDAFEQANGFFVEGRPDAALREMLRGRKALRRSFARRDALYGKTIKSLLAVPGRLVLDGRGFVHPPLVEGDALKAYQDKTAEMKTDWLVETYGVEHLDAAALYGVPVSAEEEERVLLAAFPAEMLHAALKALMPVEEARRAAARVLNAPGVTRSDLEALSHFLRDAPEGFRQSGALVADKAVAFWLIQNGKIDEPLKSRLASLVGPKPGGAEPPRSTAPSVYRPYRTGHAFAEDFESIRRELESDVDRAARDGREVVFVMEQAGPRMPAGKGELDRLIRELSTPAARAAWTRAWHERIDRLKEDYRRGLETGRFEGADMILSEFTEGLHRVLRAAARRGVRVSIEVERVTGDEWLETARSVREKIASDELYLAGRPAEAVAAARRARVALERERSRRDALYGRLLQRLTAGRGRMVLDARGIRHPPATNDGEALKAHENRMAAAKAERLAEAAGAEMLEVLDAYGTPVPAEEERRLLLAALPAEILHAAFMDVMAFDRREAYRAAAEILRPENMSAANLEALSLFLRDAPEDFRHSGKLLKEKAVVVWLLRNKKMPSHIKERMERAARGPMSIFSFSDPVEKHVVPFVESPLLGAVTAIFPAWIINAALPAWAPGLPLDDPAVLGAGVLFFTAAILSWGLFISVRVFTKLHGGRRRLGNAPERTHWASALAAFVTLGAAALASSSGLPMAVLLYAGAASYTAAHTYFHWRHNVTVRREQRMSIGGDENHVGAGHARALADLEAGRPLAAEALLAALPPNRPLGLSRADGRGVIVDRLSGEISAGLRRPAYRAAFYESLGFTPESAARVFSILSGTDAGKTQVLVRPVGGSAADVAGALRLARLVAEIDEPGLKLVFAAEDPAVLARLAAVDRGPVYVSAARVAAAGWTAGNADFQVLRPGGLEEGAAVRLIERLPLPRDVVALLKSLLAEAVDALGVERRLEAARDILKYA